MALVRGRKETGDPETRLASHAPLGGGNSALLGVAVRWIARNECRAVFLWNLESRSAHLMPADVCGWYGIRAPAVTSVNGNGLGQKAPGIKQIRSWRIWSRVCVSCRFVREMLLGVTPRCVSLACTNNKANAALLLTAAWLVGSLARLRRRLGTQAVTCRPLRVDLPFRRSKRNCRAIGFVTD